MPSGGARPGAGRKSDKKPVVQFANMTELAGIPEPQGLTESEQAVYFRAYKWLLDRGVSHIVLPETIESYAVFRAKANAKHIEATNHESVLMDINNPDFDFKANDVAARGIWKELMQYIKENSTLTLD